MGAFYRATLPEFLNDTAEEIIGGLSRAYQHTELKKKQIKAWEKEITTLKAVCSDLIRLEPKSDNWSLLLEYPIPRRHKRLDAVLLCDNLIFCLEFKTEGKAYTLKARRQVEDYALDLRDFHEGSLNYPIVPILVVPEAEEARDSENNDKQHEFVHDVALACSKNLATQLISFFKSTKCFELASLNAAKWDESPYHPVPTIIEAAEVLYAGHNIREITHSRAGEHNLTTTSDCLLRIIDQAQRNLEKVICFVTGIPGAGKTLVGLNIVHNPALRKNGSATGVFLSGNGPLVQIVKAAIANEHKRLKREGEGERAVGTFIQNVHTFIRAGIEKPDKPQVEQVVIFDEAQRAWDAEQNAKKNDIQKSEPELMLSIMGRHDWAVVIALVGGGQEINSGEAGLAEWGSTLKEKFPDWKIFTSPMTLKQDSSLAGHRLFEGDDSGLKIFKESTLHLEVNIRSFRAPKLPDWVDAVLSANTSRAAAISKELKHFPMVITRSLKTARQWLRSQTRGRRRCGLVASSGGIRLRADGLELSSGFRKGNREMYVHWFLAEPPDIRSSNQLEVAASEYECQGLELDWTGLCWAADFTFDVKAGGWVYRNFAGSRWSSINTAIDKKYLLNTYRVLLTRARRGSIIWVPTGDLLDETRDAEVLDSTAEYLCGCGLKMI